jgi:hypothetical protein
VRGTKLAGSSSTILTPLASCQASHSRPRPSSPRWTGLAGDDWRSTNRVRFCPDPSAAQQTHRTEPVSGPAGEGPDRAPANAESGLRGELLVGGDPLRIQRNGRRAQSTARKQLPRHERVRVRIRDGVHELGARDEPHGQAGVQASRLEVAQTPTGNPGARHGHVVPADAGERHPGAARRPADRGDPSPKSARTPGIVFHGGRGRRWPRRASSPRRSKRQ